MKLIQLYRIQKKMLETIHAISRKIRQQKTMRLTSLLRYLEYHANEYWYSSPFSRRPEVTHKNYLDLAEKAKNEKYDEIDAYERKTGYIIDTDWLNDLALHTQVVIKNSPVCYAHGRLLYTTLRTYLDSSNFSQNSNITIWETGTARGFSSLCMAKAFDDHNIAGRIVTFDVLPHQAPIYWNCIDDLEGKKTRSELLNPWHYLVKKYILFHQGDTRIELPKVNTERIHFAFLDGAHTYEDVIFEFGQIRPYQFSGDMIVYDDYNPGQFPGLVRAVDEVCEAYDYARTDLNANKCRGYVIARKR